MRSVVCPSCQSKNTLDSRFCRSCGSVIPGDAFDAAAKENQELLEDGQKLLQENRIEEALMLGHAVIEAEPENVAALALIGDCFERQGRYERAVESYEQILEVRPDSALDKIRLTHLRKLAAAQEVEFGQPRSTRQIFFACAAVTVLLVSVGAVLLLSAGQNSGKPADNLVATNTPTYQDPTAATAFTTPPMVPDTKIQSDPGQAMPPGPAGVQNATNGVTSTESTGYSAPVTGPITGPVTQNQPAPVRPWQPEVNNLPDQISVQQTPNSQTQPAPPAQGNNGSVQTNTTGSTDPAMSTSGGTTGGAKKDPGVVDIRPSGGGTATNAPEDRSAEVLIRTARDLAAKGDYAKAAATYEEALRKGASRGSTNQRLAQCYEKLGRKQDAITAYRRAIAAFEAEIARGNDRPSIKAALDACKQAVKTLGG